MKRADGAVLPPLSLCVPSNLSFEPKECLGFKGASDVLLMLDWKRAMRSLADLPLFSSGKGLYDVGMSVYGTCMSVYADCECQPSYPVTLSASHTPCHP